MSLGKHRSAPAAWTPLMLACRHTHTHLIQALVTAGARVHARSSNGAWSALTLASCMRDPQTVAALISSGARPSADFRAGACCALNQAARREIPSPCGCNSSAGCALCRVLRPRRLATSLDSEHHRCASIVSQLLSAGMVVDVPSGPTQRTPLYCAVVARDAPMTEELLRVGAQAVPQGGFFGFDPDSDAQQILRAAVDTCNGVHTVLALVSHSLGRSALHRSVALDALQRALARNCIGCTAILALCPAIKAYSSSGVRRCAPVIEHAAGDREVQDVRPLRALLICMAHKQAREAQQAADGALQLARFPLQGSK